jgi:hypothetical protein
MELTEHTLRTIADNLTDLRLQLNILKRLVLSEKEIEEFDNLVERGRETPKFREGCDQTFEALKRSR